MDIKIGGIYYFNNREILILKKETDEMYLVCGDFDVTNDVTGSNFCEGCMIGDSNNKLSHTCVEANEIIDTVMDNISDKNIFWVSKKYINEKPFEYKKSQKLLEEISTNNSILEKLKTEIKDRSDTKEKLDKSIKDSQLIIEAKIEEIEKKETELSDLSKEISNFPKYERGMLSNKDLNISSSTLLELIKSDIILKKLYAGGVDNWDWYSESIGDDDIDLLAIKQFKNYIK